MKLPKSSGQPKKPLKPLFFRRVQGDSMFPALRPGRVVAASSLLRARTGAVVVIRHRGMEKVKRITAIEEKEVFVVGDNARSSTDSRHFGWLPKENIVGVVFRPKWSRRG